MSDCRFDVSPVNYPDPDLDSDIECTNNYARLHSEHKGLYVAYVNICHIKPKLLLNSSSKLDILGLCETFLMTTLMTIFFKWRASILKVKVERPLGRVHKIPNAVAA